MTPTATTKKTGERYIEAIGRRKTSIANVRMFEAAKSSYTVNGRELEHYFPIATIRAIATSPMHKVEVPAKFRVSIKVSGGGISSQAGAIRLGISRALIMYKTDLRGGLKKLGFLRRDARAKERRKFGLKKARKAPQWSKR